MARFCRFDSGLNGSAALVRRNLILAFPVSRYWLAGLTVPGGWFTTGPCLGCRGEPFLKKGTGFQGKPTGNHHKPPTFLIRPQAGPFLDFRNQQDNSNYLQSCSPGSSKAFGGHGPRRPRCWRRGAERAAAQGAVAPGAAAAENGSAEPHGARRGGRWQLRDLGSLRLGACLKSLVFRLQSKPQTSRCPNLQFQV